MGYFPSFPRCVVLRSAGPEEAKNPAGKSPPPDSDPFSDAEFGKNLANLSNQFAASANRRFKFQKRRQLFIRVHNETLSVVAVCVYNPDRSPFEIQRLTEIAQGSRLLFLAQFLESGIAAQRVPERIEPKKGWRSGHRAIKPANVWRL